MIARPASLLRLSATPVPARLSGMSVQHDTAASAAADTGAALVAVQASPAPHRRWRHRIGSLLRGNDRDRPGALEFHDLRLDPMTRAVRRRRRAIELTPTEFSLLELLLRSQPRVLTRSEIFHSVWGFDFGVMSNSLNVTVGNLRRKIEAGGEPRLIHTVRGVGYVLRSR